MSSLPGLTSAATIARPRPSPVPGASGRRCCPAAAPRRARVAILVSKASADSSKATSEVKAAKSHPNLVNQLLQRAASRRERGETFCRHCKGEGVVECHTCQGAGVLDPEKVKVNMMKHAGYVVKQAFNQMRGESQGSGFNFKITNRCRTCHGSGNTECLYCHGTGRFASSK